MLKKILSMVLVLVMVFTMLPLQAFAAVSSSLTVSLQDAEGATVAYAYTTSRTQSGGFELVELQPGESFYKSDFSYGDDSWNWDHYAGYIMFFVKPNEGCLLTDLKVYIGNDGYTNSYLFPIDDVVASSNHSSYPLIEETVAAAKAAGYVAAFGFSRKLGSSGSSSANIGINTAEPAVDLSVSCNKTDVAVGETAEFTVTITPRANVSGAAVMDMDITSITVNGQPLSNFGTPSVSNGKYTLKVPYTVTETDHDLGIVEFEVNTSTEFRYNLNLGLTNTTTMTNVVVENTAGAICPIASEFDVSYDWGDTVPQGVTLPSGTKVSSGRTYTVNSSYTSSTRIDAVVDGKNGEWVFSGWDRSGTITIDRHTVINGSWQFLVDKHTVTYTDGVEGETVFSDKVLICDDNTAPDPFGAEPTREDYRFLGWHLKDDASVRILSDADIAAMQVNSDMVFSAVWAAVPKAYKGTVEVYVGATYDAESDLPVGGSLLPITTALGSRAKLYLKPASGSDFIELQGSAGSYSAELFDGIYHLYYSTDDGATKTRHMDQELTISGGDRTRYMFFYSVSYELAGGFLPVSASLPTEYYMGGTKNIPVTSVAPQKEGYTFSGWLDQYGELHKLSTDSQTNILTADISKNYVLTAQWAEAVDVKVNVTIDHKVPAGTDLSAGRDEVSFTLCRTVDDAELYKVSLAKEDGSHNGYSYDLTDDVTTYTATEVTFKDLPDADYTITALKNGYIATITRGPDEADGTAVVNVSLEFMPESFLLSYKVQLHEDIPAGLEPRAVYTKVSYYGFDESSSVGWQIWSEHKPAGASQRLLIDSATRSAESSISVWKYWADPETEPYSYRIEIVAYEMPDGTIVPVGEAAPGRDYYSENKVYWADVAVDGGKAPDYPSKASLPGAYWDAASSAQKGTIVATVYAEGFDVIFDANDPAANVNGKAFDTAENRLTMPAFSGYTAAHREAGHTFGGWYYDAACTLEAFETDRIASDVTLYAKWIEPVRVSGTVYVAGTYQQPTLEGGSSTQVIHDIGRVDQVSVVLQRRLSSGYYATIDTHTVPVTYGADHLGIGTFVFDDVPDDGSQWRIDVLTPNYSATYRNEPESISAPPLDFGSYSTSDFEAEFGSDDPAEAVVNAYLAFDPEIFRIKYQVDATAIGDGYRPDSAEVLLLYCADDAVVDSQQWPVISQMVFPYTDGSIRYMGLILPIAGGVGENSFPVWQSQPDGRTLYEYAMRLQSYTMHGAGHKINSGNPFDVSYQGPAVFRAPDGQSMLLKATLTPKQYTVTFDMGTTDAVTGMDAWYDGSSYTAPHTWSYDTAITAEPQRAGYIFGGWYADSAFSGDPVSVISADTAEDVTLYARWIASSDRVEITITLINTDEHQSSVHQPDYEEDIRIQLTSADATGIYTDVTGKELLVDGWHADGNSADTFQKAPLYEGLDSRYTYSANVTLRDYYEKSKTVTTSTDAAGNTTYKVNVIMQHRSDTMLLPFSVEMEKDALGNVAADEKLWPESADIRITAWWDDPDDSDGVNWNPIIEHRNDSLTVALDENGEGSGSFRVWHLAEDGTTVYHYRIEVVALTMSDGTTVLPMGSTDRVNYSEPNGIYSAEIVMGDGSEVPAAETTLKGVFGLHTGDAGGLPVHEPHGSVKAVISVSPCDVTLKPNGGSIMGNTEGLTLEDLIYMPDLGNYTPVRHGYSFGGWFADRALTAASPAEGSALQADVTLWAKWTPDVYNIYYDFNEGTTTDSYSLTYTIEDAVTHPVPTKAGHVFMGWYDLVTGESSGGIPLGSSGDRYFGARWEKDDGGDGVPDIYQIKVRFVAESGGSLEAEGGTADTIERTIDLKDALGNYIERGSVTVSGAKAVADTGYAFLVWSDDHGSAAYKNKEPATGSITFDAEGGKTYTFTASFSEDEGSDGVPDIYQATVTFKVQGGTYAADGTTERTAAVTLLGPDGYPAAGGTGYLAESQIPAASEFSADAGHDQATGAWIGVTPATTSPITGDRTFTYGFDVALVSVTYKNYIKNPDNGAQAEETVYNMEVTKKLYVEPNGGSWRDKQDTIVFENLDASKPVDLKIPADPVRENYVFEGWLREEVLENGVNAGYRLIAQWTPDFLTDTDVADRNGNASSDGIADKYQAVMCYTASSGGTVVGVAEDVFTFVDSSATAPGNLKKSGDVTLRGSEAAANDGFVFDSWQSAHSNVTLTQHLRTPAVGSLPIYDGRVAPVVIQNAAAGETYTAVATFARDELLDADITPEDDTDGRGSDGVPDYMQYTAYFNHGPGGSLSGTTTQVFTLDGAPDGSYKKTVTPESVTPVADSGYALRMWTRGGDTSTPVDPFRPIDAVGGHSVTFTARFGEDTMGGGDGIPDEYQIFVVFESAEPQKGTVSGDVVQTVTVPTGTQFATVDPDLTGVVVTPESGYTFHYWKNADTDMVVDPDEPIYLVPEGTVITFKAYFEKDEKGEDGPDGIPDIYEATVTYHVANGFWGDGTDSPKTHVFALKQYDGRDWVDTPKTLGGTLPTGMTPDSGNGYKEPGYWGDKTDTSDDISADTPVTADASYTFTFGERYTYTFTITVVNGTCEAALNGSAAFARPVVVTHGDDLTLEFEPEQGYAFESMVLDGNEAAFTPSQTYSDISADHTIVVTYGVDNWNDQTDSSSEGDDIADSRQVLITFSAGEGGSISGSRELVYTVPKTAGGYKQTFAVSSASVTAAASPGYLFDRWVDGSGNDADPFASREYVGGSSYAYKALFTPDMKPVDYSGYTGSEPIADSTEVQSTRYIAVDPNGGVWQGSALVQTVQITDAYTIPDATRDGYIFMGWKRTDTPGTAVEATFTAMWQQDIDDSGVADIFEKRITFRVVNGSFLAAARSGGRITEVSVTLALTDQSGRYSESGSAALPTPPATTPDAGYTGGSWSPELPLVVRGTEPLVFTYTYEPIPAAPGRPIPSTGVDH